MKEQRISRNTIRFLLAAWLAGMGGCTTATVEPMAPIPPEPPGYVKVPHPEGLDYADLLAIFTDPQAPSPDALKECDSDFAKLRQSTASRDEQSEGARELIRKEPVKYHWCFYGKLLALENDLRQDAYIDEKQKLVLDTYLFLTPFARAFQEEFHDSRYLRWAAARYQRLSEFVFYRRVQLSEEVAARLGLTANPFGLLRPAEENRQGVLEKYGLVRPEPMGTPMPEVTPSGPARTPAAETEPVPAVEPPSAPPPVPPLPSDSTGAP